MLLARSVCVDGLSHKQCDCKREPGVKCDIRRRPRLVKTIKVVAMSVSQMGLNAMMCLSVTVL
jgi:hypothetical protein